MLPLPRKALLLEVYEHRGLILFTALVFVLGVALRQQQTIAVLRANAAAKPLVDSKRDVKETREEGRVIVVKKYLPAPACVGGVVPPPVLVEERTEREPVTIVKEVVTERTETPICPPERAKKTRYVGVAADPLDARHPRARLGLTFFDALDVGAAYDTRFTPASGAVQAEVSYRF